MVIVRNWKNIVPVVSHETAIVWSLLSTKGAEGKTPSEAPLEGFIALTLHRMQPGKSGDYHIHSDKEQVYYFTKGRGKMNIDDKLYEVRQGDAICAPIEKRHQLINDSDEWIEHLIINGKAETTADVAQRNWLDSTPHISHGAALLWSIFTKKGTEGKTFNEAPLQGIVNFTLHRLQPGLETGTHTHAQKEQVYYFTEGYGQMIVGDEKVDVRPGDAVYGPAGIQHGLINNSDDWLEHLIISAAVA